jgi:hypothetical protein
MRDTTTIPRPYFREGTDALASLVATRPARDVLLNVAAELVHRERPAARRLAAEVAALLGGVASIADPREHREICIAPDRTTTVLLPIAPAHDVTIWPNGMPTLGTPDSEMRDDPAPVTAKPARKPADAPLGSTSRQRRAFGAMSQEMRDHLRAWDAWHMAWRAHCYFGGPNPGAEPVDNSSPEARERAARAARYEAEAPERMKRDAAHLEYWGGDLAARDKAVRSAPKGDMADAAHVAKVKAHMAAASEAARKRAEELRPTVKQAAADAGAAMIGKGADRRAAPMVRTTSAPSASASNRARAF